METSEPTGTPSQFGPYLNAAFLCERVLTETDGVNSAIRIIDRLTFQASTEAIDTPMPPHDYHLTLFLMLKTGQAPGLTKIEILLQKPDNFKFSAISRNVNLERPEDKGINIRNNLKLTFDQPGVWWFHIKIKDEERTRVPLEIIWLPQLKN